MGPARTTNDTTLFDEVRSLSALKGAWDHVRSQALKSKDPEIKRERSLIDSDTLRYLRALQRQLGSGDFSFERQKGVLKRREGKPPRPIVVSPLRNRIVQRAILDVCQSDRPRIKKRLGSLPKALATPTSVGGLPGRGVAAAIHQIKAAIEVGATRYVRSDLKNFFGNLPRGPLHAFLDENLADTSFIALFKSALDVDLANADQDNIQKWWELFPNEDTGVPQGSALSEELDQFVGWFLRTQQSQSTAAKRRMWGIALLADTPKTDPSPDAKPARPPGRLKNEPLARPR